MTIHNLPIPPSSLRGTSDGHANEQMFVDQGDEFLGLFVEIGGLQPGDDVLDVGCGVGRMARPLAGYLGDGNYTGFDVVKEQVDWCRENITSQHPNFTFLHVDVANSTYNGSGAAGADGFRFPFDDASFDFVFLASVFTHMKPAEVENYLSEIARVLRPGGRSLITWFLLTPERMAGMDKAVYQIDKAGIPDVYHIADEANPDHVVGYHEPYVRRQYEQAGMTIEEPIRWGFWSGTPGLSGQDIVVAHKR